MDPLVAYLAAERAATISRECRHAHQRCKCERGRCDCASCDCPRVVAVDELLDAVHAAQSGDDDAIRWIASDGWDIAHALAGEGERAEDRRRLILGRILLASFLPSREEAEFDRAAVLAAWESSGHSVTGTARVLRVSRPTARSYVDHALAGTEPSPRGRPRREEREAA